MISIEIDGIKTSVEDNITVLEAARNLFKGIGNDENMPTVELKGYEPVNLMELLVKAELCSSKGEARRLIEQGGISIDNEKKNDPNEVIAIEKEIIIKKGKKTFVKVRI